jgi:hypothetical protein
VPKGLHRSVVERRWADRCHGREGCHRSYGSRRCNWGNGPQGPTGDTGATGPQGPTGPAGPDNVFWYTLRIGDGLSPYCQIQAESPNAPSDLAIVPDDSTASQCAVGSSAFVSGDYAATADNENTPDNLALYTGLTGQIVLTNATGDTSINVIVDLNSAAK